MSGDKFLPFRFSYEWIDGFLCELPLQIRQQFEMGFVAHCGLPRTLARSFDDATKAPQEMMGLRAAIGLHRDFVEEEDWRW